MVGLSNGIIPAGVHTRNLHSPDFHGFTTSNIWAYLNDFCYVSGNRHYFECPNEAIKPKRKWRLGDVVGCGILLNPEKKLAVFFTGNGILMGQFQCGIGDEFKTNF
jgi:hypothetical protein